MTNQEIEVFVHAQGVKPKVVSAAISEALKDVLIRANAFDTDHDDILVFVGECDEALKEPEDFADGADEHAPVDVKLTLEALNIRPHHHVHCHRCRHVAVEVNFGGGSKHRRFSPATTVKVVTEWARRKFHLDPAAAAEYVLQLCGTHEQPRLGQHLGELVGHATCSLCFNLVKEVTPQG
jgi:hypothetical protein